jgi:hypothetical protein
MQKVLELLKNPTIRRLLVFLVGLAVTALHRRFGIELNAEEIVGTVVLVLGYIGQSAFTDASKTRSDALVEASRSPSPPAP